MLYGIRPILRPFFQSPKLVVVSELPLDECVRRLKAAGFNYIGPWRGKDHPVRGSVFGTKVTAAQNLPGFSSFQINLSGHLKAHDGGTRFDGAFTNPLFRGAIPLGIGIAGAAILIGPIFGGGAATLADLTPLIRFLVVYLLLWLVGVAVTGGRAYEQKLMSDFMVRTLNGKIVEPRSDERVVDYQGWYSSREKTIRFRLFASVFFIFAVCGAAAVMMLAAAVKYVFFDRPAVMQVLKEGTVIEAELLACHDEETSRCCERFGVDYRWRGADGKTRTLIDQPIPDVNVYLAVCGQNSHTVRILTSKSNADLHPIIEAMKSSEGQEKPEAALVLVLFVLVAGTLLSFRAPIK